MESTDLPAVERLARIDARTSETQIALDEQGVLLRTAVERLNLLVELLTPKEGEREGVPLDELLAHLIRQNTEQLSLTRRVLEAIQKLGEELPGAVASAVRAMPGGDKGRPA